MKNEGVSGGEWDPGSGVHGLCCEFLF